MFKLRSSLCRNLGQTFICWSLSQKERRPLRSFELFWLGNPRSNITRVLKNLLRYIGPLTGVYFLDFVINQGLVSSVN